MNAPSNDALRSTLMLVDNMSQDAFGRIASICQLALLAMEQPARPVDMEDLAQMFRQIGQAADQAQNCISCEAENHGCNYKDESWYRRSDARRAWLAHQKVGG